MTRAMLAAGGLALIAEAVGSNTVRAAIVDALAAHRAPDGGYLLEKEWHYLIAHA